jgi:hypothetical protein
MNNFLSFSVLHVLGNWFSECSDLWDKKEIHGEAAVSYFLASANTKAKEKDSLTTLRIKGH